MELTNLKIENRQFIRGIDKLMVSFESPKDVKEIRVYQGKFSESTFYEDLKNSDPLGVVEKENSTFSFSVTSEQDFDLYFLVIPRLAQREYIFEKGNLLSNIGRQKLPMVELKNLALSNKEFDYQTGQERLIFTWIFYNFIEAVEVYAGDFQDINWSVPQDTSLLTTCNSRKLLTISHEQYRMRSCLEIVNSFDSETDLLFVPIINGKQIIAKNVIENVQKRKRIIYYTVKPEGKKGLFSRKKPYNINISVEDEGANIPYGTMEIITSETTFSIGDVVPKIPYDFPVAHSDSEPRVVLNPNVSNDYILRDNHSALSSDFYSTKNRLSQLSKKKSGANDEDKLLEQCPYCFKDIDLKNVHFRNVRPDALLIEDKQLENFFNKVGINQPVHLKQYLSLAQGGYTPSYDNNGLLISLTSKAYGFQTSYRLCPHCHNDLPTEFGKIPLIKISLLGASNVGKTVYMYKLIETLEKAINSKYNGYLQLDDGDGIKRKLRMLEERVYEPTQIDEYIPPTIYTISFNDKSKEKLLCAVYDVAGEILQSDYGRAQELLSYRGEQIRHSNGILLLLHPDAKSGRGLGQGIEDNDLVISTFYNVVQNMTQEKQPKLAVILSKSDRVKDLVYNPEEYAIFHHDIQYLDDKNLEEINRKTKMFLDNTEQANTVNTLEGLFPDDIHNESHRYFAVSCLGETPDDEGNIDFIHQPYRVVEPFLWLLQASGIKLK